MEEYQKDISQRSKEDGFNEKGLWTKEPVPIDVYIKQIQEKREKE